VGLWPVGFIICTVNKLGISNLCVAGSISQTLTYPFDVLRRKMQVAGMKNTSVKYSGALHALSSVIRTEGLAGLYRGLWPNLREYLFKGYRRINDDLPSQTVKVAPSIATSFFTYELVGVFYARLSN